MNTTLRLPLSALVAVSVLTGALALRAEDKPKYTVKEVMKSLHKGDDALIKKINKGEGTKDELKKLVEAYTALPLNEAPKGDAAEWKKKTTVLLAAAKDLEAAKPGALDAFKKAVNCKACHSEHKPD